MYQNFQVSLTGWSQSLEIKDDLWKSDWSHCGCICCIYALCMNCICMSLYLLSGWCIFMHHAGCNFMCICMKWDWQMCWSRKRVASCVGSWVRVALWSWQKLSTQWWSTWSAFRVLYLIWHKWNCGKKITRWYFKFGWMMILDPSCCEEIEVPEMDFEFLRMSVCW